MTARGATLVLLAAALAACGDDAPEPAAPPPPPDVGHLAPELGDPVLAAHELVVGEGTGAAWADLGRALLWAGELGPAEDALLRAADLEGADPAACLHAAGVAAMGSDRERAARHLEAALAAGSPAPETRLRLAFVLEQLDRLDEAERRYREVADARPSSHALLGLGRVALARGDVDGALALLEQARVVDDRHTEVLIALAQAYRRAGDERRAQQFARAVETTHQVTPFPDAYLRAFVLGDG